MWPLYTRQTAAGQSSECAKTLIGPVSSVIATLARRGEAISNQLGTSIGIAAHAIGLDPWVATLLAMTVMPDNPALTRLP
jgi:hypothetical protein